MTSSITYSLVTLTIVGVTSFSQLMNIQNVRNYTLYSINKSYGKVLQSVQDGGIAMDTEGFVNIFNLFCVLESK